MHQEESVQSNFNRVQLGALIVGIFGAFAGVIGLSQDSDHFFHIYLVGFVFWLELSLGCLALLMIPNLAPARWSLSIERVAAAGARTLPLMAVLFVPLLFGLEQLFPWYEEATAGVAAGDLDNFGLYLAPAFFIFRAVLYFVIWIGLAIMLTRISYSRDNDDSRDLVRQGHLWSIIGGILFFITATFAAFDWSMAMEEEWFSSIYGWLAISRQALGALSLAIIVMTLVWRFAPFERVMKKRVIADLGAIYTGSLVGWAYLAFTQYIVIWSGNVSSKTIWYAERTSGSWESLAIFIVLIHGLVFIGLIIPGLKRNWPVLAGFAAVLIFMRLIDIYWTVMPTFRNELVLEWWDVVLVLGMGGLWIAAFVFSLKSQSLLPLNRESLVIEEEDGESYEVAH